MEQNIKCNFNNTPIDTFLKMSFDKTNELRVKRILESNLPYRINITPNKDEYDTDLECSVYLGNTKITELVVGYIEVEHCKRWDTYDFPSNWEHSFLERKIHKYNYFNRCFTDILKDNSDITYYIRCNDSFTNFLGATVKVIHEKGRFISYRSNRKDRKNSFMELSSPTYFNLGLNENIQGILEMINNSVIKKGLH